VTTPATPSCLYYLPMNSATLHCCTIPTKCSSAPCVGFPSWLWRIVHCLILLRSCAITLHSPSYGDAPPSSLHPSPSPFGYSCTLSFSLVPTWVSLFAPPPHPHVRLVMPRLREAKERCSLVPEQSGHGQSTPAYLRSCLVPHPRHPLSPPQAKVVFHLCHRHGLAELNGLTFRVILSAFLLDLSQIWPRLHSQHMHALLVHHPSLPRHLLRPPHRHLLCLLWRNSMLKRKNYNWKRLEAKLFSNRTVLRARDSEIRSRFFKIWSSQSVRTSMTSIFGWNTWTNAQRKLNLLLSTLLCSLHSPDSGTNAPTSPGAFLAPDFQGEDE
jgi:hypothetical protein